MRRMWTRVALLPLVAGILAVPGRASAAVVLADDFEGGVADGWQLTGGQWRLSTDGSSVLRQARSGAASARAGGGDPAWAGYPLTARVKPASLAGPQAATGTALSSGAIALVTERAAASFDDVSVDTVADIADTQAPSAPGRPELLDVTPASATITWPAATDNVGVTSYLIYFGGQFYEDYLVRQVPTNAPVTVPLGGTTGASLHLSVRAVDAAGNQSGFGPRVTFGQPPSFPRVPGDTVAPPGAPVITSASAGDVVITWAPATDDTGVVEYHVVHAFNIDEVRVRHKLPGDVTSAAVAPASIPNQVWVIAYDAAWNAARGPSVTLTYPNPPAPPPGTVTSR